MSNTILRDQRIFLDGYEVSSRSNTCQIQATKDVKDVTTFTQSDREKIAGIKDFTFGAGGFMEIDATDTALWAGLNGGSIVMSVTPEVQALGGIAYVMKAVDSNIQILGAVGDVAPFQIGAAGDSLMSKGMILAVPATPVTASGNGTVQQNTDAATGKKLKMTMHVTAISGAGGPTLTATLKSSAVVGMTSTTDVATSQSFSAIGAQYIEATLADNKNYFRLTFAVTGTNPSFTVLIAFAII
jgi:hypothetical protein